VKVGGRGLGKLYSIGFLYILRRGIESRGHGLCI
jgi:hypothetical protein